MSVTSNWLSNLKRNIMYWRLAVLMLCSRGPWSEGNVDHNRGVVRAPFFCGVVRAPRVVAEFVAGPASSWKCVFHSSSVSFLRSSWMHPTEVLIHRMRAQQMHLKTEETCLACYPSMFNIATAT